MQQKSVALSTERAIPTGQVSKTNLPVFLTPLLGREHELVELSILLQRPGMRLMTLTGPGGVGKTRLGVEVARALQDRFADGVYFVPLAPVSDPDQVIPTIAKTLGVREAADLSLLEQLQAALLDRHLLLFLDNFEQVVPAAPRIAALVAACPRLSILVTSRAALRLSGEYDFAVLPLPTPNLAQLPVGEYLAQNAAVALFLARAEAINSSFRLTPTNAYAIAETCVRLDGLPLAIELAAVRIKLLPPQALLKRLSHRLDLLTGGAQDLPARQQTLRNTLQWSYDLLSAEEQQLFRRLSVFVGGWTLEAVEAICYHDRAKEQVLALEEVTSLLDMSLIFQVAREGEEPRLRMLMTVREYGLECLRASGDDEQTRRAHALYYLSLAEEAERQQFGGEQARWLAILEQEYENLRAALHWLSEWHEAEMALRLSAALYWFWTVRGYIKEGHLLLEKALAESAGVAASVRAKALKNAGGFAYNLRDNDLAERRCQESLALYRELGDTRGCAMVLYWLGLIACWTRYDYAQARVFAEEALALHRTLNDPSARADALMILVYVAINQGNYAEARLSTEQALACFREANDAWGMAYTLQYVGRVMIEQGDYALARAPVEESLALSAEIGYIVGIAYALGLSGHIALRQGDLATARALIEESVARHRERGHLSGVAEALLLLAKVSLSEGKHAEARSLYDECLTLLEKLDELDTSIRCLEGLGAVMLAQGQPARATLVWSAAARLRGVQGIPMSPLEREDYRQAEAIARSRLGEQAFASLWTRGQAMTREQAFTAATQEATSPAKEIEPLPMPPTRRVPTYPAGLTAREIEVLRLVAQGLTDAQVAEQLVISLRTVTTHLTSIYNKLGVSSRVAATRFAIEQRLV